jgi:hypothetical protein
LLIGVKGQEFNLASTPQRGISRANAQHRAEPDTKARRTAARRSFLSVKNRAFALYSGRFHAIQKSWMLLKNSA